MYGEAVTYELVTDEDLTYWRCVDADGNVWAEPFVREDVPPV